VMNLEASCRKYRHLASCLEFLAVPTQLPDPSPWAQSPAQLQGEEDLPPILRLPSKKTKPSANAPSRSQFWIIRRFRARRRTREGAGRGAEITFKSDEFPRIALLNGICGRRCSVLGIA
jgi:hypothetical protein